MQLANSAVVIGRTTLALANALNQMIDVGRIFAFMGLTRLPSPSSSPSPPSLRPPPLQTKRKQMMLQMT